MPDTHPTPGLAPDHGRGGAATGARLLIRRADLHDTRLVPDPDAPDARPLGPGEARLAIVHFALTANNITYAVFGELMKYWQFFPAPDPAFGCLPVWGFATVAESRVEGLAEGRRVWGYVPAGSHLVVAPSRVGAGGFVDGAAHREGLAAVYNQYVFCDADPTWQPALEGLQAVLRPLFFTSWLIDDFLEDNGFFGASQVILSSASSKTGFGTAFCLSQRRGRAGAPEVIGLTSPARRAFVESLGCYDRVIGYDAVTQLDRTRPTVYVDFAGDAALRRTVHEHFGDALRHDASIGGTHWEAVRTGGSASLPGPKPVLFFAPAQIARRTAPPPQGWGGAEFQRRGGQAWQAFLDRVRAHDAPGAEPWVRIVETAGGAALEAAYRAQLEGRADAREGWMIRPAG